MNRLRLLLITAAGTSGLVMLALRSILVVPATASAEAKPAEAPAAGGHGEAKAEGGEVKAEGGHGGGEGTAKIETKDKLRLGAPPRHNDLRDVQGCRPEEIAVLRDLRTRSLSLDARETSLTVRSTALAEAESEISQDLGRLERMRKDVLALVEESKTLGSENTKKLAKVVDQMKATDASDLLTGMDEDTAVDVLQLVKPRQAGKILGAMEPIKAAHLGDRLTAVPDPRPAAQRAATPTLPPVTPSVVPTTPSATPNPPAPAAPGGQ